MGAEVDQAAGVRPVAGVGRCDHGVRGTAHVTSAALSWFPDGHAVVLCRGRRSDRPMA